MLGETLSPLQLGGAVVTLAGVSLINADHIQHELDKRKGSKLGRRQPAAAVDNGATAAEQQQHKQ